MQVELHEYERKSVSNNLKDIKVVPFFKDLHYLVN